MIARDLLQESSLFLKEKGAMGFLECELLLAAVLGISREELFVRHTRALTPFEEKIFWEFFVRRMKGEPLAYILGKKEFYGLEFFVDRRVMIPRPETEMMVEWVIEKASEFERRDSAAPFDPSTSSGQARLRVTAEGSGVTAEREAGFFLVDVGTGSGNIAISVAKNVPDARVMALDISPGALEVCEKNVLAHGVYDRVVVRKSDLLGVFLEGGSAVESIRGEVPDQEQALCFRLPGTEANLSNFSQMQRLEISFREISAVRNDKENCSAPCLTGRQAVGRFAIVAANLPYIGTEKNYYISRSVEDFEPHEALFGGADGLEWYRRLFRQISALKVPPRYVVGEIGFTQGEAILEEIRAVFPKAKAEVKEDLAGLPRMFILEPFCHPEPA